MRYRGISFYDVCLNQYKQYLEPLELGIVFGDDRSIEFGNDMCNIKCFLDTDLSVVTLLCKQDIDKEVSLIDILSSRDKCQKWLTMFPTTRNGDDICADVKLHYQLISSYCVDLIAGSESAWLRVWQYLQEKEELQNKIHQLILQFSYNKKSAEELNSIILTYYEKGYYGEVWSILSRLSIESELPKEYKMLLKWSKSAIFKHWLPPPVTDIEKAVKKSF